MEGADEGGKVSDVLPVFALCGEAAVIEVDAVSRGELSVPLQALVFHAEGESKQGGEVALIHVFLLEAIKDVLLESFLGHDPKDTELRCFDLPSNLLPVSDGCRAVAQEALGKTLEEKAAEGGVVNVETQALGWRSRDFLEDLAIGKFLAPVEDRVLLVFGEVAQNIVWPCFFNGCTHNFADESSGRGR